MSQIEKSKQKIQHIDPGIKPGDLIIQIAGHSTGGIYRVDGICKKHIKISGFTEIHYADNDIREEWSSYGDIEIDEFNRRYAKLEKPIEELEAEVFQRILNIDNLEDQAPISDETALATNDKHLLIATKEAIELKKKDMQIMMAVLERKTWALHCIVDDFEKTIKRVQKVIDILELYMGIHEEIMQIQEGECADLNEPISIRQMLLFMDEEVGITEDKGLDFQNIGLFDQWVLDKGLDVMLPEKKGIVALRIRRKDKDYGDAWLNVALNANNHETYFLMRNGDNVYRIWSNIHIAKRFFPTKKEFTLEDGGFGRLDEEEVADKILDYKKHFLLIQGLIDRTDVFKPLKNDLQIFQEETWDGQIRFIRDDELKLPTGRKSFRNWRSDLYDQIKIGSRVLYLDDYYWYKNQTEWMQDRVGYMRRFSQRPSTGIYSVVAGCEELGKENLRFIYMPSETVETYDYYHGYQKHDRKRGLGFAFDNEYVFNYDMISLDDIEFYINSRVDRHNYLKMLPVLRRMKKERLKEIEYEKQLVKLISDTDGYSQKDIWETIEWWKYKNKWKRPIDKDDAKALRMINKRLAKESA